MIDASQIVRSRRRTLALIITRDARLEIRSPLHTPVDYIEKFVARKSAWIDRKIAEVAARPKPVAKEFIDGEEFLYLGKPYRLMISDAAEPPLSFDNGFVLSRRRYHKAKELFVGWYREEAIRIIRERLDRYSALYAIKYERFTINGARSKWGSCAGGGNLSFSWRLMMAPIDVIDYVVIHELAHIERKDHSKHFWNMVESLFPGYKESTRWLKDNGHLIAGIL